MVDHSSIPIIGDGDVKTSQDAKKMLGTTGVDALLYRFIEKIKSKQAV